MLELLIKSIDIIPKKYRKRLLILQLLLLATAVLEFLSVLSIAPFISLAINPGYVQDNVFLKYVYDALDLNSEKDFIILVGLLFVALFGLSNAFILKVQVLLVKIATVLESEFSVRLYKHYLSKNYLASVNDSSNALISKINHDVKRLCIGVILPFLQINARLLSIIILIGLLLSISGLAAFVVGLLLGSAYLGIFYFSNSRLKENGQLKSQFDHEKTRILQDGIEGKRYVELYGLRDNFSSSLKSVYHRQVEVSVTNKLLQDLPYFFIETLAFLCVVIVIGISLSTASRIEVALAELGVICLAGYRLIPKFQQVYRAAATIKTSQAALLRIHKDLIDSFCSPTKANGQLESIPDYENIDLVLKSVSFSYQAGKSLFNKINVQIKQGQMLGIVGSSGAGKSTLMQIMTGEVNPDSGSVCFSGVPISNFDQKEWLRIIGFVDSSTYIFDATVKENILLGCEYDEIWMSEVLKMVCFDEVVQSLPEGLESHIGNKGLRLSSGQLQRLGFARAIYRNPKILFMDEATNALDSELQNYLMSRVRSVFKKTIFIAISHRKDFYDHFDQLVEI